MAPSDEQILTVFNTAGTASAVAAVVGLSISGVCLRLKRLGIVLRCGPPTRTSAAEKRTRRRERRVRSELGIDHELDGALLELSDGHCMICGRPPDAGRGNVLHCDHDHDTGRIRGMLCGSCNRALGMFRDRPEVVMSAISYLQTTADGNGTL